MIGFIKKIDFIGDGEVPPPSPPAMVTDLSATPLDTEIGLMWNAPDAGDGTISDYTVQYKESSSGTWLTFSDGTSILTSATVTGLTNDASYDFRVAAVSEHGTGAFSDAVSETPVADEAGIEYEVSAARHWVLGDDNTDMLDGIANAALVPATAAPTHHSGYLTTAAQQIGGLKSDSLIAEGKTMISICRARDLLKNKIIIGGFDANTGCCSYFQTNTLRFFTRGSSTLATAINPIDATKWYFVAISLGSGNRIEYVGDSVTPYSSTRAHTLTTNAGEFISIGDTFYNISTYDASADYAEFIIFNSALNLTQIGDVYTRSVARMAARGITVS